MLKIITLVETIVKEIVDFIHAGEYLTGVANAVWAQSKAVSVPGACGLTCEGVVEFRF